MLDASRGSIIIDELVDSTFIEHLAIDMSAMQHLAIDGCHVIRTTCS